VHYTKGYLSKVETGSKNASLGLARLCDVELDADGTLSALVHSIPDPGTLPGWDAGEDEVWLMELSADGASRFTPLSRREALGTGGGSLLGIVTPPPRSHQAADHKAAAVSLADAFGRIRELGQQIAPATVLPLVISHGNAVRTLAYASTASSRNVLVSLGARYAEYAGWLTQECGDTRGAVWWTDTAVQLADQAGDPDMAANALVRRALIALYRHDAADTIALAQRAQSHHYTSARIRGLAALREAQGHALAGDHTACEKALERGTTLLVADEPATARHLALGPVSIPNIAALIRGWCYHDLGYPAQAIETLTPEIAQIPVNSRRTYARFAARLALAHAAAGDIEQSCHLADRVTDAATATDSATVRTDIGHLARAMTRWPTHEHARATRLRLTELLYEAPV
jgi:hypothetical protein